uniref:Uncharacterized protein n=1 Tax=Neospora caninum (strain Liverpool) TaxID=572307 RepID=A0A0F7UFB3_NEOCL|nr:TPA: hypothetical protein BN1204_031160 [Neospora caninum Liverpool]
MGLDSGDLANSPANAVVTTPVRREGTSVCVDDPREPGELIGHETKQKRVHVNFQTSFFHGSHVGKREQEVLARVEAVASCVQMEVLEKLLVVSNDQIHYNRNEACESGGDKEPGQAASELDLSASEADPEKGALDPPAAAAAGEPVSGEKTVAAELRQKRLRLPFSDTVISLVVWDRRKVFPEESANQTSSLSTVNSKQESLFEDFAPQSCISYTLARLDHWRHTKPVAFASVRAQLLRELASRIHILTGVTADPFDTPHESKEASRPEESLAEARDVLANDAEVQRLLSLYGRLLQFDIDMLLPGSQWWRFQRGYSLEEHSPLLLPFYPWSTLLQRIRRVKGIKCLRPPLRYTQVQPHLKLTVDIMHVCLTDHYLFGSEDVLAHDVLRLYEVYCFLSNYQSGEQLTTRLRSAILYSEEQRSLPPSEHLRRLLASSLLCSVSCKINGRKLPRRAHVPLKVPTFSSTANHLLPSLWDYGNTADVAGCGRSADDVTAGHDAAGDEERAEFSFGMLLTESLEELSFSVELHHAGCAAPLKTTASVPISPELTCLTRPPPLAPVVEYKELFPSSENYSSSSAALASPVSIYVDVPFSSSSESPNCEGETTKQQSVHSVIPIDTPFEQTGDTQDPLLACSPAVSPSHCGAPRQVANSLSAGRSRTDLLQIPSLFGPFSRRGSILFQNTQLRLAVPRWDEEMAAAAQGEAAAVAAAMAAELEQEAYQAAAVVAAAAEAARQIAVPEEPAKFPWLSHRDPHGANAPVAHDPDAHATRREGHGQKLFNRKLISIKRQRRELGTEASQSPAGVEQPDSAAAAEEHVRSSPPADPRDMLTAEGTAGKTEATSGQKLNTAEAQPATPLDSVSPHPGGEHRRPSPPTFSANASHGAPPNDADVVPQQLTPLGESAVIRNTPVERVLPAPSQSLSSPRLPRPIYNPAATDPALDSWPVRPHIVASSASGATLPPPAVVPSDSVHQVPARSRRLLSFTRVSSREDTEDASTSRIPLSYLFSRSIEAPGGSGHRDDAPPSVALEDAERESKSRRKHKSIPTVSSHISGRSRTSEQLAGTVDRASEYPRLGSQGSVGLMKGGLKLRVTLAPVPPGERAAEALVEGYEALVLRRQHLRAAVEGDASLVTLYRHLPTAPGDLYDANRAEERAYAAAAAASAIAAAPAPEAAYAYGTLQPRRPSPQCKRVVLLRDKKQQDFLDTRLGRSRPLAACVRLLLLLQRNGGFSAERHGLVVPLLAASAAAFVAPATVERFLDQSAVEVPGLDAEAVALLQSMQKKTDEKSRSKQRLSREQEMKLLRDGPDEDEEELDEDDANAEDIYTQFLRGFLTSALPVQVGAVLKSSSHVDFPAIVNEVVPRLNISLLFHQIKACCFTHRLLGFSRYVDAKAARRRATVIDQVDDRSIGIFVKVNLGRWRHRHRVGDISASLDSPADFYLYSPRAHLQYSAQSRSRSAGATPFTFIGPSHTAYAEALQLSNPVVEVKYVNRARGIHVAVATKAVSGENPIINQLVHLTLPKVSGEKEALIDLTKQDSYLILNVFDHHQRDAPPARRFLGSLALPWSLIIGYGLEDCFWTPSKGEGDGKNEHQDSSWRSPSGHNFRIRRRRKEGPDGPVTLCVIRGCLRLRQPVCLTGYQRPTIKAGTRWKSTDRGRQSTVSSGPRDSNTRVRSESHDPSAVRDASNQTVKHRSTNGCQPDGGADGAAHQDATCPAEEPLSMYISLSLYVTGVPLSAVRTSIANGSGHPVHIWRQAQESIAASQKPGSIPLSNSSSDPLSLGAQGARGGDNSRQARGESDAATEGPVAREGKELIIREEHWRNHCRRGGVWNPCSAFGLDLSGSLFLLCRLVAPLFPPPEVATPGSPRCFERIAAFISLFPVVEDRLLLSVHAGDRVWMNAQEQVDVGCGDSRGHALLLCCFFTAFDLILQTQCSNYVARARLCDRGVQYVVLRQAPDRSVQVWDPLEPRCVFLPSATFRKRRRQEVRKNEYGLKEREGLAVPDTGSPRPPQALTPLQQQQLIQQNALLREQQNDQVAGLRARHEGLLEGSHDKFLKQFSKQAPTRNTQTVERPSPVCAGPTVTAGQGEVQAISTRQDQLGLFHSPVQNAPACPAEEASSHSLWDGAGMNHDLPFLIGGTCDNQEKGVLPIEGIDLVFNNENVLTNLQSMECVSSSSNGATRHRGAGEGWEPLTGGCSVPESDRTLRDKIRQKLLRRRKTKCCGIVYVCRLLKDFIHVGLLRRTVASIADACSAGAHWLNVGETDWSVRLLFVVVRFSWCNWIPHGSSFPTLPLRIYVQAFETSSESRQPFRYVLRLLQQVEMVCAPATAAKGTHFQRLPRRLSSLNNPSAVAAASKAFRDCLLQKNDCASAAEAAALALGATSPDALLRISLFPPVGMITPMAQALRYRGADFAQARALEVRLQRHIEAHIKALYRRSRPLSPDASGRTSMYPDVSTMYEKKAFGSRGASTAPLSRPMQSVFFCRDAATEIYQLLRHFETSRMCMAWQQPISPDERRRHKTSHSSSTSVFPGATIGAKYESPPNVESCAQAHSSLDSSSPTAGARRAQADNWAFCCARDLESRLQDCLRRYYKDNDAPYAVPLHFSRMDKHFVWQLLENTGVFSPVPPAALAHRRTSWGASSQEQCRPPPFHVPLGATVAVVVRVFAYPCGVYSGWVCAARLG